VNELLGYVFSPLREGDIALYRGTGNGLAPILLVAAEDTSLGCVERFEHEYALKAELDADWAARPVALTYYNDRMALVLEDPGGEPVDRLLGQPLDVSHFLRIAIPLAGALRQVHERGLIHKDIKPANILVDAASGGVWLTGFGIASRLPREHQAPAPPEVIAGTLAYMAPEQTGRMNRSVDSRSDLYALGVTLYEMLTGQLPFTAADPMEWVHCHIARHPVPPNERVAGVAGPLSAIVMKLLAKTVEERYQTAAGVEADLRRCLAEWASHGRIDPFLLGAYDISDRLLIPEKLYGREREVDTLLASFDRVVANGTLELVLVSGYSGIGKSSVVNELHKALVPSRGLFASGKFDQYKRDIPYATLAQAVQTLIRQILSKSDEEADRWREVIREAVDPNGQLIVNLIPELRWLIGEQPSVTRLPPQQEESRFHMVFSSFLGVFARKEHPLALFLDDLQWLDSATLKFLEHLMTRREARHLLLIGAFRNNEVGPTHPLMRTLDAIRRTKATVRDIELAPLSLDDVTEFVADTLRCGRSAAEPLARLAHQKTLGNPLFAIQFLTALGEEHLLELDAHEAIWTWDVDRIKARDFTDNVVDLMVSKLQRLPASTQETLKQLACLGNSAEIKTLSIVHGRSEEEVHSDLWEAVRLEFIERVQGSYRFVHDRVQEAAYSLIPEEIRAEAHLRTGRLLTAHTLPERREEAIFEIVNQFNRGVALITSREEREQLAEFNLIAGKRAKAATAYASALTYLTTAAALLADDCWERRQELIFPLELHRAECEFLTGELAAADERLTMLSSRAANIVDQSTLACLRVDLYTTLDQSDGAVAVCLAYLRHLGVEWSPHPTDEEVRREYERIWSQLGTRAIEELIDLPLMSDPASLATLDLLTRVVPPALFTDANFLSLVICRMVNLSLERGNSDGSCFAYVWLGVIAGPHFGNYKAGFCFGRLGYELIEKRGLKRFEARTCMVFGNLVVPWTKHVRAGRDLLRRAFEAANRTGDLTFAAYSCQGLNRNLLAAGDPLVEVQREAEIGLDFAQKVRFGLVIDVITSQLGLIRTLRGLMPEFGSFNDEEFDELLFERRLAGDASLAAPECWYWIRKLQARFFAADYASALDASIKAQRLLWTSPSHFETAEYHFYSALCQAVSWDSASPDRRRQHLEALAAHHKQIEIWAENCPENFETRAALVSAEIARIDGRDVDAMRLYERAIRSARANGFIHNEALANELASRFYAARAFDTIAHAYLREARHCYLRWGAFGKVRQLEQFHPHLRDAPVPASPTTTIGAPVEQLDVGTVLKAAQAVSGEIVLGKLIKTLLRIAVENAGAERGLLILFPVDEPRIVAEATTGRGQVEVTLRQTAMSAAELPESVLHYVIRTRQWVILDDALAQNPFPTDEYICQKHARSVLCVPLVKQSKLIGVLYLENNLASHVFTPTRISVLELLAAQAAISLENAQLYTDLQLENRERERVEQALRQSEQRFRDYAETASDWFWETGPDHVFTYISERVSAFGFDRLALIGKRRLDAAIDREAEPQKWREHLATLERHEPFRNFEYRRRDLAGQQRPVSVNGRPIFAPDGRFMGYRGTATDLTKQHEAEERLRQSQKMDAIGQLTGGIAHDFNNILTVITGTIEILIDDLADKPDLAAIAGMIDDATTRGANLTGQLLAFARKQPLQPRDTDINTLIIDTARLLRPTLGEEIEIESMLEEDCWHAMIDPSQLSTALLNLAVNARDAMRNGGKLTFGSANAILDEAYAEANPEVEPGAYVMIAVSDTGTGIPAAICDRVFEPFFTTKEIGKGTGLGLSMAYGFVKQSGGHIKIYSEEGHGTTIKIYLPRNSEVTATSDAPAASEPQGGHETILVVEDDALVRRYVVAQLHSLGYATISAANGPEALELVDQGVEFDVLFTDVIMPGGMSGRQLADEIAKRCAGVPVLYTSGYPESAIVHHGRLDPGIALLNKPYRKADLACGIREALAVSAGVQPDRR
jgi:PAS domain S-box-containing protein